MIFLPRKFIAAAVLAVFALPGWAQTPPPAAPTAAPAAAAAQAPAPTPGAMRQARPRHHAQPVVKHHGHQQMRGMPSSDERAAYMQEHRAHHHAQLKQALQLSPAQESAWTEFTAAMEQTPGHARLGWEGMEQLTTPERIDRMRALRIQHAAEADRRGDAVKAFYAQLNPAQQKTLDAHHGAHPMAGNGPRGQGMAPDAGNEGVGAQHQYDCQKGDLGMREGRRHGRHHGKKNGPRAAAPAAPAAPVAPSAPAAQ